MTAERREDTAGKRRMKREINQADMDWAHAKVLELFELVARRLAGAGEPELAQQLRAWR